MDYRSFIKRDYKSHEPDQRRLPKYLSWRRRHIVAFAVSVSLGALLITAAPFEAEATRHEGLGADDMPITQSLALPQAQKDSKPSIVRAPAITPAEQETTAQTKVKRGDTLAAIFARYKLSATELHNIMALGKPTRDLRYIKPGDKIHLRRDADGKLLELTHEKNRLESLRVTRAENGFQAKQIRRQPETRITYATSKIDNSLFEAGQKNGLPQAIIMELAGIFGWDIDFALDIRQGDEFRLVYEEQFLDGEKIRNGNILAAEFVNQGRSYRAVRYQAKNGRADYYTPSGQNMRKTFLRSPVDFRRISSRFGKRHHPVLNRMRLHKGVDYAAARGTPIRATGDGKIIFRGRKGGYGKTVIIQHGSQYSTLYAHMSSYNRKAGNGSKVKQGQIIGYVGATGRATGPHLHYEFRVHGAHRNPLTVKLPNAASINKTLKADFLEQTRGLIAQLDGLQRINVALAETR
ncbi:OapA family protein [Sulfuriflexus mobilis]|uniref:OapA family protein n=1 Tax=Sulfuriflexus mobilis TaxID=1811807 RepID=UPI0018D5181E|nr:peptidoglycan DD-metalloendopeptidase family protein [Sulfuriflexus mobilis]